MSVLVAHPHDALIPRKRTSSFSFPLRPSKAPRLGLSMGSSTPRSAASTTGLRRTESYASLTELLLEAVSTPSTPSKQSTPPPKGKDIPYTRTLQYQQDQRLARRRKASSSSSLSRSDTLPDLSTPVAVAAHHLKEPSPTPSILISPAPQRLCRSRSKSKSPSSSAKGHKGITPPNQQRQPTPPSHYRLSLSLSSSLAPSTSSSSQKIKRRPTPQLILPTSTSTHAIPLLLTPRTTSPLRPSPSPSPVPGRPVFPRSKKDLGGQLRKAACVRRMEMTERGKTMKAMGVRGAVEVWKATVDLEEMVGMGKGDDMDVDVDAEGDTDEECDVESFEDVEIDGLGKSVKKEGEKRGQGLALSRSWVVVPGEDWEMVDCAVA